MINIETEKKTEMELLPYGSPCKTSTRKKAPPRVLRFGMNYYSESESVFLPVVMDLMVVELLRRFCYCCCVSAGSAFLSSLVS